MSSSRQVTDLGEFYARKGAEHERLRIIEWLYEVNLQIGAEGTAAELPTGPSGEEARLDAAEKRGACAVITVLIEKLESGE